MRIQSTGVVALVRAGPAAPAKADDAGSGDGADSPGRLVRADVKRDTRALTEAVEQDLAAKADPAKPDEAVDKTVHILTTTQKGNDDTSPLKFNSNEKLAYFEGLEKAPSWRSPRPSVHCPRASNSAPQSRVTGAVCGARRHGFFGLFGSGKPS